jgi:hypothetical protein
MKWYYIGILAIVGLAVALTIGTLFAFIIPREDTYYVVSPTAEQQDLLTNTDNDYFTTMQFVQVKEPLFSRVDIFKWRIRYHISFDHIASDDYQYFEGFLISNNLLLQGDSRFSSGIPFVISTK